MKFLNFSKEENVFWNKNVNEICVHYDCYIVITTCY